MTALLAGTFLLLQLLWPAFATEGSGRELPAGYVTFPEYGAAYKIHEDRVTWAEARDQCVAESAHLAVITSRKQLNNIVNSTILNEQILMFIGIYRESKTSRWLRVDSGQRARSVRWGIVDHEEDSNCAAISRLRGGVITNAACDYQYAFICEKWLAGESFECEPPSDYVKFPEYNAAYKIHEDDVPWATARDRCAAEGAHLAVITSVEQMKQIVNSTILEMEMFLFIGIWRPSIMSNWIRSDNGRPATLIPWSVLTDDEDYNCAAIWRGHRGAITNLDCDYAYAFICEISTAEGCTNPVSQRE